MHGREAAAGAARGARVGPRARARRRALVSEMRACAPPNGGLIMLCTIRCMIERWVTANAQCGAGTLLPRAVAVRGHVGHIVARRPAARPAAGLRHKQPKPGGNRGAHASAAAAAAAWGGSAPSSLVAAPRPAAAVMLPAPPVPPEANGLPYMAVDGGAQLCEPQARAGAQGAVEHTRAARRPSWQTWRLKTARRGRARRRPPPTSRWFARRRTSCGAAPRVAAGRAWPSTTCTTGRRVEPHRPRRGGAPRRRGAPAGERAGVFGAMDQAREARGWAGGQGCMQGCAQAPPRGSPRPG